MTNLLQDGVAWLGDQLRNAAGRTVVYRRGTQTTSITAVGIRNRRSVIGDDSLPVVITNYEWQVKASDLLFGGTSAEPRPGDQIIESIGAQSVKYQVLELDATTPCFEFLDESGQELLIHTSRMR